MSAASSRKTRAAAGFIAEHRLWTAGQSTAAADLRRRVARGDLRALTMVRLAWADPHGAARAKMVSVPVFLAALESGYNINVATTTLDASGARVFSSFTAGGGMGLAEMTGSPNLTVVPDPATFRVLPWAPDTGWILCDEYFTSGVPFHFSPRQLLKREIARLAARGLRMKVGLEVEWYLARVVGDRLADENVSVPGLRGRPIATAPLETGYSYHSETNLDLLQPVLAPLAAAYQALGLPLRSIEKEYGPGQVECTFNATDALRAADDYVLFRTATRQVCRRHGHFATFMARPALYGHFASGWHLHQSLADARSGANRFVPGRGDALLSPLGRRWAGGLLEHAAAAAVFASPTVNGYRRYKPNSLAPDRASWGFDHRGAMLRVIGGPRDAGTRIENRAAEPGANPYLFIASQIAAGLDGIERALDPGAADDEPYAAERAALPRTLEAALDALAASALYRERFGAVFIEYYLKLKRTEAGRFAKWLADTGTSYEPDVPTRWEQNEYYDFF